MGTYEKWLAVAEVDQQNRDVAEFEDWKSPVSLAVALIIFGFLLRAWGSIPLPAPASALAVVQDIVKPLTPADLIASPPPFRTSGT